MAAIATPLITGSPDSQQRRSFPRTSSFASKTATHPHQKEDDPPPAPPSSPVSRLVRFGLALAQGCLGIVIMLVFLIGLPLILLGCLAMRKDPRELFSSFIMLHWTLNKKSQTKERDKVDKEIKAREATKEKIKDHQKTWQARIDLSAELWTSIRKEKIRKWEIQEATNASSLRPEEWSRKHARSAAKVLEWKKLDPALGQGIAQQKQQKWAVELETFQKHYPSRQALKLDRSEIDTDDKLPPQSGTMAGYEFTYGDRPDKWVVYVSGVRSDVTAYNADIFQDQCSTLKRNVLAMDARGLGNTTGRLRCDQDLIDDVVLQVLYLRKTRGVDPKDIVLDGHSLGGGLVLAAAKKLQERFDITVDAVIVNRSYANFADTVESLVKIPVHTHRNVYLHLPIFSHFIGWCAHRQYGQLNSVENATALSQKGVRICTITAKNDPVIPQLHSLSYHWHKQSLDSWNAGRHCHLVTKTEPDPSQMPFLQDAHAHTGGLSYVSVYAWVEGTCSPRDEKTIRPLDQVPLDHNMSSDSMYGVLGEHESPTCPDQDPTQQAAV